MWFTPWNMFVLDITTMLQHSPKRMLHIIFYYWDILAEKPVLCFFFKAGTLRSEFISVLKSPNTSNLSNVSLRPFKLGFSMRFHCYTDTHLFTTISLSRFTFQLHTNFNNALLTFTYTLHYVHNLAVPSPTRLQYTVSHDDWETTDR